VTDRTPEDPMKLLPGEKVVVGVQAMLDNGPTAPLDAFVAEYEADDNIWWVIGCGHHQNLFDEAVERMLAAEVEVERLRAQRDRRDLLSAYDEQRAEIERWERGTRVLVQEHNREMAEQRAEVERLRAAFNRIEALMRDRENAGKTWGQEDEWDSIEIRDIRNAIRGLT
jgi:hypothetical protein